MKKSTSKNSTGVGRVILNAPRRLKDKPPYLINRLPLLVTALALCAQLHAQSTTGIYVSPGNNVYIGRTNGYSGAKLEVHEGTNQNIAFDLDGSTVRLDAYNDAAMANVPLEIQGSTINLNGGNIGIGTSTPTAKLELNGSSYITNRTVPTAGAGLETFFSSGQSYLLSYDRTNSVYKSIAFDGSLQQFNINGAEKMRIDTSGNVGIGTTSPSVKLEVNSGSMAVKPSNTSYGYIALNPGGSSYAGYIDWYKTGPARIAYMGYEDLGGSQSNLGLNLENGANFIVGGGNVGIGTANPQNRLVISNGPSTRSQLTISDTNTCSIMLTAGASQQSVLASDVGLSIRTGASWTNADAGGTTVMTLLTNGNVGIGTSSPQYALDVNGDIHANSYWSNTGSYADFVFKPGYKLPSLNEEETSIEKEGHLPGIPSEKEAKTHGINLADMQVKLLQKIEELTLHQIEQQKLLEDQNKRLDRQSQRIDQLEKENTELREGIANHQ